MSAEQLIALEAAQAELGTLYLVACGFSALRTRAEAELLPRVDGLGRRLRRLLRTAQLSDDAVEAAAREVLELRSAWQADLERVRTSAVYQRALAALTEDRQDELRTLIPHVLAGLRLVSPAPPLYFPVSPSSGRRRPGSSPFLSPPECAERIVRLLAEGYEPEAGGTEWWEREFAFISCADHPAALETPISLRLASGDVRVGVFTANHDLGLRIFTPRLRAPMSIVLAADATDEWWEAYQDSYREFRTALERELTTRGYTVSVVEAAG